MKTRSHVFTSGFSALYFTIKDAQNKRGWPTGGVTEKSFFVLKAGSGPYIIIMKFTWFLERLSRFEARIDSMIDDRPFNAKR